ANLILRDTKSCRLNVNEGLIELTMAPPNHAQLMMLQVGQRSDVWAELQFGVAPASGIFDILWHEGVEVQSYCARVDTQQGRVAIGLVPASGSGGERWLASRNGPLGPGSEHTLLLISRNGSIQAYLDGKGAVAVNDSTLTKGMVRLRLLPAPQNPSSTLLLRRLAVYRPPS
ncbi:MAG: hypothetical protein ACHQ7M_07255, partial [Chloroflexota bacterium]